MLLLQSLPTVEAKARDDAVFNFEVVDAILDRWLLHRLANESACIVTHEHATLIAKDLQLRE